MRARKHAASRLQTVAAPFPWTQTWDPFGRENGVIDPEGCAGTQEYDLLNRVKVRVDALGYRTSYSFDELSRVRETQDARGYVWTTLYDFRGNHAADVDPRGNRTSYNYDDFSRQVARQDALGYVATTYYDLYGRHEAEEDAWGHRTTQVYDFYGRPWATVDALGHRTTTLYDNYGRFAGTRDALGGDSLIYYDALWRVEARDDPMRHLTTTVYDPLGRVWATEDALGRRTTTGYDPIGRVVAQQDARGYITTTLYDDYGRTRSVQDPLGYVATIHLDRRGLPIAREDALGYRTSTLYDCLGRPREETDAAGYVATTLYDPVGSVRARVDRLGYRTSYQYDPARNQSEVQDARGYTSTTLYDALNRPETRIDPLGYARTTVYDRVGNALAEVDELGYRASTVYDALRRPEATVSALGHRSSTVYDRLGRVEATVDALNRRTTSLYDPASRKTGEVDARGFPWSTVYDPVGNVTAERTPLGALTSFLYDEAYHRTGLIDPLQRRTTWTFDEVGRMHTRQNARGEVTSFSYSPRGEETVREYANGTRVSSSYDPRGLLETVSEALGIWSFTYDFEERVKTVNGPGHRDGQPLTSSYDEVGNRTLLESWWGRLTFGYDPRNLLTSVWDPGYPPDGVAPGRTTWTYDPRRLVTRRDNPNGTRTTTNWDADRQPSQIWHSTAAGAEIEHAFCEYDAVGNPSYPDTKNSRSTFSYDELSQLTSEHRSPNTRTTWTYDASRRRDTETDQYGILGYQYDDADELLTVTRPSGEQAQQHWITLDAYPFLYQHPFWRGHRFPLPVAAGTVTFGYDLCGNRTVKQTQTGVTTYGWDVQDRLVSVALPSGARVTNTYRAGGLRLSRADAGGLATIVWDGAEVLSVEQGTPQLYVRGADLTHALGPSLNREYHLGRLGEVQALTDGAGGTETAYAVDAWGNVLSGSAAGNPYVNHGGLGYWYEPDLGMSYVRARWLDAEIGGWLSVDPVAGEPRYSYARNMPTTRVDSAGRDAFNPYVNPITGEVYHDAMEQAAGAPLRLARWWQEKVGYAAEYYKRGILAQAPKEKGDATWWIAYATFDTTLIDVVAAIATGPAQDVESLSTFGEGTGAFAADPKLQNLDKLVGDLGVVLSVLLHVHAAQLRAAPPKHTFDQAAEELARKRHTIEVYSADQRTTFYPWRSARPIRVRVEAGELLVEGKPVPKPPAGRAVVLSGNKVYDPEIAPHGMAVWAYFKKVGLNDVRLLKLVRLQVGPTDGAIIVFEKGTFANNPIRRELEAAPKPERGPAPLPKQDLHKLPDKQYSERERGLGWNKYQRKVVGRDFEERYRLPDGAVVGVDGDDGLDLICAKFWWTGETTENTPTFPESRVYPSVVRDFIKQAGKLRTLRGLLGRRAVVYRFADVWAARHYEGILRDAYPADFREGRIRVEVVRPRF